MAPRELDLDSRAKGTADSGEYAVGDIVVIARETDPVVSDPGTGRSQGCCDMDRNREEIRWVAYRSGVHRVGIDLAGRDNDRTKERGRTNGIDGRARFPFAGREHEQGEEQGNGADTTVHRAPVG